jgi:hypothetical protein
LDNIGIFTVSGPTSNGKPQQCIKILGLFTGGSVQEIFSLTAPSSGSYQNIPYTQLLGYFLNYSYYASASQSLEFASQESVNNNNYATPVYGSFGNTAGPVSITTSASQPAVYGTAAQVQLTLANVGTGIVLGLVQVNVSFDSSMINLAPGSGFTAYYYKNNGTTSSNLFTGSINLGASGATLTLPMVLNPTEQTSLNSQGIPYVSSNMQISIAYEYEQDGFFPLGLGVQNYYST